MVPSCQVRLYFGALAQRCTACTLKVRFNGKQWGWTALTPVIFTWVIVALRDA